MTTTDRARTAPARTSAASSVRSYLIAFLATGYVATWWWLGAPAPAGTTGSPAQPMTAKRTPRTVWFDELLPTARPVVSLKLPSFWGHARPQPSSSVKQACRRCWFHAAVVRSS